MGYDGSPISGNASTTLPQMEGCGERGLWSFAEVEERLVEAMAVARRVPDRERSWLHVKAFWPDIREADIFDYPGGGIDGVSHIRLRPLPLSAEQMDAMTEAESWLGRFLDMDQRALIVLALGWKAAGRRVGWARIARITGAHVSRAVLAKRYMTAIATIACGLNGKGQAAIQMMVRKLRAAESRERAMGAVAAAAPRRGRRRRVEVAIVYSEW